MPKVEIRDQEYIIRFTGGCLVSFKPCHLPERGKSILPACTVMTMIIMDPAFPGKIIFCKDLFTVHDRYTKPGLIKQWWREGPRPDREEPDEVLPDACDY